MGDDDHLHSIIVLFQADHSHGALFNDSICHSNGTEWGEIKRPNS